MPNPPQNVILRQTSPSMVTITWDPPVGGHHDRYYLAYQKADGTGFMDAVLSGTSTGFILDGLEANQNYQFGLFSRVLPDTDSDLPPITFIPLGELFYLFHSKVFKKSMCR